ncbi:hypothetical protein SK128_002716, partial [Halocaridina rubra]
NLKDNVLNPGLEVSVKEDLDEVLASQPLWDEPLKLKENMKYLYGMKLLNQKEKILYLKCQFVNLYGMSL